MTQLTNIYMGDNKEKKITLNSLEFPHWKLILLEIFHRCAYKLTSFLSKDIYNCLIVFSSS